MKVRSETGRLFEIVNKSSTPMPSNYIAVLWGISQFADVEIFDPSYNQIAKITGVNIRTVQRAVVSLENRGHIVVIERFSGSGHQISHRYQLGESGAMIVASASKIGTLVEVGATGMRAGIPIEQPKVIRKVSAGCPSPSGVDVVVVEPLRLTTKLTTDQQMTAKDMLSHLPVNEAQVLADELRERMAGGGIKSPLGYLVKMIEAFDEGKFKPILAGKGAKMRLAEQNE